MSIHPLPSSGAHRRWEQRSTTSNHVTSNAAQLPEFDLDLPHPSTVEGGFKELERALKRWREKKELNRLGAMALRSELWSSGIMHKSPARLFISGSFSRGKTYGLSALLHYWKDSLRQLNREGPQSAYEIGLSISARDTIDAWDAVLTEFNDRWLETPTDELARELQERLRNALLQSVRLRIPPALHNSNNRASAVNIRADPLIRDFLWQSSASGARHSASPDLDTNPDRPRSLDSRD
jgi:hypothetical protein